MFRDVKAAKKNIGLVNEAAFFTSLRKRFHIRISHNLNMYWTRLGVFGAVLELSWRRLGRLEDVLRAPWGVCESFWRWLGVSCRFFKLI